MQKHAAYSTTFRVRQAEERRSKILAFDGCRAVVRVHAYQLRLQVIPDLGYLQVICDNKVLVQSFCACVEPLFEGDDMATILLAWNPRKWRWGNFQDELASVRREGRATDRWSCGKEKGVSAGCRFFLIKLGVRKRGIVGSGWTTAGPFLAPHWDLDKARSGEKCKFVNIQFDRLFEEPRIPWEVLQKPPYRGCKWGTQMSGISIPEVISSALEHLWGQLTGELKVPEEVPSNEVFHEGSTQRVMVNTYERDATARAACIRHYGARCFICGFEFESHYGPFCSGYIHVHHLRPLSEIGLDYSVNPIKDLRPICPNCHAFVHLRKPPFTPEEVKALIRSNQR